MPNAVLVYSIVITCVDLVYGVYESKRIDEMVVDEWNCE